jgi:UDP-N-acetylmuramate: L-alanyl-gamma-D-glutamyl-meso-diaminopimelate ligase
MDDFGHHPTAIRETLRALRIKYPRKKIWAVFEPRSNTTRRKVFQEQLVAAFSDADAVVVAEVARLEQIAAEERLDPEKLMQDLKTSGKDAAYLPDVDSIVTHIAKQAQGGDIVCVFSNGGFGGIHGKLLEQLGRK